MREAEKHENQLKSPKRNSGLITDNFLSTKTQWWVRSVGKSQHLQMVLGFTFALSRLHKHPKTSIILIVNVTCKTQVNKDSMGKSSNLEEKRNYKIQGFLRNFFAIR